DRYSLWLSGVPIGAINSLQIGALYNISNFWGIALEMAFLADNAIDYVEARYLIFGVKFQPRHEWGMKVMFGGTTSGTIWLWDNDDPAGEKEKVGGNNTLVPPAAYSVELDYRLNENTSILVKVISALLEDYELTDHFDLLGNSYTGSTFFITYQKEFPIGL
ncbi:MAG: hypothetical protein V3W14_10230, partial [Candidatus Neomarinimicrobiota bacterium]